nr:hypothetical protein [Klebsiella pneumoniae subsp. pneumoniae]
MTNASAERSAAGCIKLNKEPIVEYLNSNIVLLKWMIAEATVTVPPGVVSGMENGWRIRSCWKPMLTRNTRQ